MYIQYPDYRPRYCPGCGRCQYCGQAHVYPYYPTYQPLPFRFQQHATYVVNHGVTQTNPRFVTGTEAAPQ